mmetsp:Transcript_18389/g.34040  ORF Transcript_18389/g.34040 Transcript_18389/m.34040 type:complete len:248 (-) Transcript_18389:129-872(-)
MDGTHKAIVESEEELASTRDRELRDAALYKELRIKEIEAMYKYDCKAATEAYQSAVSEIKENLLGEISETIKRMEDLRDGVTDAEVRSSSRKLRSKKPEGEEEKDEARETKTVNPATESTKSINYSGYGNEQLSGVNFFMPENDVRKDLISIQMDWKTRAEMYLKTNEVLEESVKIADGVLYYNEFIFEKDTDVVCTTEITKEEMYGTIQVIKPNEVILKLNDGSQARLLLKNLRSGRCTIALQEED